jgi:hypothetical protein
MLNWVKAFKGDSKAVIFVATEDGILYNMGLARPIWICGRAHLRRLPVQLLSLHEDEYHRAVKRAQQGEGLRIDASPRTKWMQHASPSSACWNSASATMPDQTNPLRRVFLCLNCCNDFPALPGSDTIMRPTRKQNMKFLISNDDGYFSPGIRVLAETLARHGEVVVVAPERDRSGASNSLTLDRPLTVRQAANGFYYVNGTPPTAFTWRSPACWIFVRT